MIQSKNTVLKFFIFTIALFLCSCESEPVTVDSSFSDNNSFLVKQFSIIDSDQPSTSQDLEGSIGNSQRLYSGTLNGENSTVFLKMNFDVFNESEYCEVNSEATLEDSMISVIDSVRLVLNAFTQFLDENDELLIEENLLDISVGFISGDLDSLDILQIFDQSPSTITTQLESITDDGEFSSAVTFKTDHDHTMYIHLPFDSDEDWCNSTGQDYIVMIEYIPMENDDVQYIELLSSQDNSGPSYDTGKHRPSLDISYKKITETSSWIDIFTIDSDEGVVSEETQDIYYVYNDTLNTKSTILLAREMEENFNDSLFNLEEIYLNDIELSDSFFQSGTYDLDVRINLNEDIIE